MQQRKIMRVRTIRVLYLRLAVKASLRGLNQSHNVKMQNIPRFGHSVPVTGNNEHEIVETRTNLLCSRNKSSYLVWVRLEAIKYVHW
jgi:hypothetical protein